MNKLKIIILAILGGIDIIFNIAAPILLVITVIKLFALTGFNSMSLLIIGILSSIFKAVKVGWLK